jgi:hypothetical protein
MESVLVDIANSQGGMERLKNTPLPNQYRFIPAFFTRLFCVLLPIGLVETLGFATPVGSSIAGLMFLAALQIGDDLVDPFSDTVHDLPLSAMCRTIEIDLLQAIGDPTQTDEAGRRRALVRFLLSSSGRAGGSGGVVDAQLAQLAIERRAPDPQPPRDLGHAAAIMADRQADDIGLDILQRAQIAVGAEQVDPAIVHPVRRAGRRRGPVAERGDLREIRGVEHIPLAQHGGAEERVLQLADIARPVIAAQQVERPR